MPFGTIRIECSKATNLPIPSNLSNLAEKRRSEVRRSPPPPVPDTAPTQTVEPTDQKCVSSSFYWGMIVSLVVLLSVQLSALGVFIVDRFILKRSFSKEFRVRC